jgi:hypothetical protein
VVHHGLVAAVGPAEIALQVGTLALLDSVRSGKGVRLFFSAAWVWWVDMVSMISVSMLATSVVLRREIRGWPAFAGHDEPGNGKILDE